MNHSFYEFFAGGGMARLGLGADWNCLLANDISPKKMQNYRTNFGDVGTICCDVAKLRIKDMPGKADLAWASFPCQDLSLAGNRAGLIGERSGTFWGFWSAINRLKADGRAPSLLVIENVCGLLTSHSGQDFQDLCRAVTSLGYDFGAVVVDAVKFLPQSRPRLFIVCTLRKNRVPEQIRASIPSRIWHTAAVCAAVESLPADLRARWIWWNLPAPQKRVLSISDIIEIKDSSHHWNTEDETRRLLKMMSPINLEKVNGAKRSGLNTFGTIYKRTRIENGKRIQRAEVRFDGVAGCLRTPQGGSSRQLVIAVERNLVRTRLLSIREAARLMGVDDTYRLPENYNDGYHIFGDGLAVPAVGHIAKYLLNPILGEIRFRSTQQKRIAA